MSRLSAFKGHKFGIVGLGNTGVSAYWALKNYAQQIICYDDDAGRSVNQEDLVDLTSRCWQQLDRILVSPGILPAHPIFKLARAYKIPITSDVELLFEQCPAANFIAVTGTNGKSTTTALIAHILNINKLDYPAGGNIGCAALSLPLGRPGYVLELSSFQLDLLQIFRARVAILLNITPDHLDRYHTMQAYISSKEQIFSRQQPANFRIIGVDNPASRAVFAGFNHGRTAGHPRLIAISAVQSQPNGVAALAQKLHDNIFEPLVIDLAENKYLPGAHNRENIAASYAACRLTGLAPEQIIAAISSFKGLAHRMQYVGSITVRAGGNSRSLNFYNDSKATNSAAAAQSITALDNIYWLAGGIAKAGGIEGLAAHFARIRKAYFFGQAKELFAQVASGKINFQLCDNLAAAFKQACLDAERSDDRQDIKNILLAPAGASQDQFKDFEERGNHFISLCQAKIAGR